MTSPKSPAEAVAEARAELFSAICAWASHDPGERLEDGGEFLEAPIADFAAAVRTEAFEEMRAELDTRRAEASRTGVTSVATTYGQAADWAKQQAEKARGR